MSTHVVRQFEVRIIGRCRRFAGVCAAGVLLAACGGSAAPLASSASSLAAVASSAPAASSVKPSPAPSSPSGAASSGPASPAGNAALTPFGLGLSSAVAPAALPAWISHAQGFDRTNGLNLNVTAVGAITGLQALITGDVQAEQDSLAPAVVAQAHGAVLRTISATMGPEPWIVTGAKGIAPDNAAERLKGGKFGVSTYGSESDLVGSLYLQRIGLTRNKDVNVLQIGTSALRLTAILNGAVDATPLDAAQLAQAEGQGLKLLWDVSTETNWAAEGMVVSKSYLDSHRAVLLSFLRTVGEGYYYALSHPDDGKKVLASQLKTSDPKVIDTAYEEFVKLVPKDLRPSESGIVRVIQVTKQVTAGIDTVSEAPTDYADLSLLNELQSSGFFDRMKQQYGVNK